MLDANKIKELAGFEATPCVSIYLPTHRTRPETEQDRIRLKNLLSKAQSRLQEDGLGEREAQELLAPALARVDDAKFWQHQRDGLALFLAPSHDLEFRLPLEFPEEVYVGVRFYIRPLLPLVANNGCFYLLTIAQDSVRLFAGSRHQMDELETEHIPRSIDKERGLTEYQEEVGFHPSGPTPTTTGTPTPKYHAGGEAPQDVRENQLKQWLHSVANGVVKELGERNAPLVIAADERNYGHFRSCCAYPHLLEDGITEHPESLSEDDLHRRAWALAEPEFERREAEACERFAALAGDGQDRVSQDVPAIVQAAWDGRVEILFVADDEHVYGTVDSETGEGQPSRKARDGEELLDRMAAEAILTGAEIYPQPQEKVPGTGPAAAIFRY